MLSPIGKHQFIRIIPLGVIWLAFALVYLVLKKGILGDLTVYPATGNPYDFKGNILITSIMATVFGLLVGVVKSYFK